jgi:hypothetical protein
MVQISLAFVIRLKKHVCIIERKIVLREIFNLGPAGDLPWFRELLVDLSAQNSGFDPRQLKVSFVLVKNWKWEHFSSEYFEFSPVTVIPPVLRLFNIFRAESVIQFSVDNVASYR